MMDDTADAHALARAAQRKAIRRRRRAPAPRGPADEPPRLSPSQRLGRQAEDLARRHLEAAGARVLARNLRCAAGEIDLVCEDRGVLAFVEVRQRRSGLYGGAAASVNRDKQQRLIRAAAYFLPRLAARHFRSRTPRCRFDVVALQGDALAWIKDAFGTDN